MTYWIVFARLSQLKSFLSWLNDDKTHAVTPSQHAICPWEFNFIMKAVDRIPKGSPYLVLKCVHIRITGFKYLIGMELIVQFHHARRSGINKHFDNAMSSSLTC